MTWHLRQKTITVPAGTPKSAPLVTAWLLEQGWLTEWEIAIPAGHAGTTGIRLLYHGTQMAPWDAGEWITTNRERLTIPWHAEIMINGVAFQTYNTGAQAHTFICRARIDPVITRREQSVIGAAPLAIAHPHALAEIRQLAAA